MEKTERVETHDFMNVESFSQLPFIRPAPPVNKEKGIRLFGKEFGGDYPSISINPTDLEHSESADHQTNNSNPLDHHLESNKDSSNGSSSHDMNGESTRKFECHYCCRNFPTSQALGGHQNAHKRERQHAKRAHLQSAMMHHGGLAEAAHVYGGLMNYHHRLGGSVPTPALAYHHHSWSKTNNGTGYGGSNSSSRFYGGGGGGLGSFPHLQPPTINGSPLAAWRIPTTHHHHHPHGSSTTTTTSLMHHHHNHSPVALLGNDDHLMNPPQQVMSSNNLSQAHRLGYETKPTKIVQDHVSLDLHL